jgi:hypothetical protein
MPVPSVVLPSLIVGDEFARQHTPLDVTGIPPSKEMLPPDTAEELVIFVTESVVNSGTVAVELWSPLLQAIVIKKHMNKCKILIGFFILISPFIKINKSCFKMILLPGSQLFDDF